MSSVHHCSFCHVRAEKGSYLVTTEDAAVAICRDCAEAAVEMLAAAVPAIELTPSGRAVVRWFNGEVRP